MERRHPARISERLGQYHLRERMGPQVNPRAPDMLILDIRLELLQCMNGHGCAVILQARLTSSR